MDVVVMYKTRIPRITAELLPLVEGVMATAAETIAARARDRVPVHTGRLREAIHVERDDSGGYAVIAGDTDVFYGHIVEHGGAYTPAQPFLIPALEESAGEVVKVAAAALRKL